MTPTITYRARTTMAAFLSGVRDLSISLLAGLLAGILAGGLGGRLVMRLVAVIIGPSFTGSVTDNGNFVGDITLEGTVELIVFGGLAQGLIGGFIHWAVRPWLAPLGRWQALAFGLVLLAALGFVVITPENPDFRRFGSPAVNAALFAAIYVAFGVLLAGIAAPLERAVPDPDRPRGIGLVQIASTLLVSVALLLGLLVLGVLVSTARALIAAETVTSGLGLSASLVVLGALAAGLVARALPGRTAGRAVVAVPLVAGAWLTASSIARIVGMAD